MLAACTPAPQGGPAARAAMPHHAMLPAMKTFEVSRPTPPQRANRDIMRDFLDLSFEMESGRALPVFSRFEGPVTVRLTGAPAATTASDLDRLIGRLRAEAGLDVRRVTQGEANITIEAVRRARIHRHVPTAACFVVPNISRLSDYRRARTLGRTDWTRITTRDRIAIFIPGDASPQETRDCLHEELAQALGPLNDLYRLPDSVFNDDNMHGVLTGFDMLILRAYYAPDLSPGMTRAEVAARLPAILTRLNPRGDHLAPRPLARTPRAWIAAVQTALGPGTPAPARRKAAERAVQIAAAQGLADHQRGFSHFARGKLVQAEDPALAHDQFLAAERAYRRGPETAIHRAHVAAQLAGTALDQGRADDALTRIDRHREIAARHENASLLATLLMLRADALEMTGQSDAAQDTRLDSLGWARYGFGSGWITPVAGRHAGHDAPGG